MQLSQFKAVAKPRNAWQAIDLGFVIAKTAYWKLFLAEFIPASLCFAILTIIFWDIPSLSAAITWWLKPMWERAPLYIISREIFTESVSLRQVQRNYWHIIKIDLLWWITIRRFSPSRSFDMPVTVLEQLKGSQRRKRLNLLHRRLSNGATWLLITCAHIEGLLIFGFIAAFFMLVPQGIELNWMQWFETRSDLVGHLYDSIWMLVMALVAPFYTSAGFALYLQRRIDLEGWDIEICFRNLAERRKKRNAKLSSTVSVLFLLCLCVALTTPQTGFAQQEELFETPQDELTQSSAESVKTNVNEDENPHNTSTAAQHARKEIINILKGEDFQDIQTKEGWRIKQKSQDPAQQETIPEWMINVADWLGRHGNMFSWLADFFRSGAKLIELLLWIVVIGLILFLLIRFRYLVRRVLNMTKDEEQIDITPPKVMFGLDVTEESLPENVVESAKRVWRQDDQRQALGILLRSTIIKLLHDHKFPFHEGNTEKECAEIVERDGNAKMTEYFWLLTRHWQAVAYAHRECSQEAFFTLCQSWQEVFADAK